jgi:hypothetical protein
VTFGLQLRIREEFAPEEERTPSLLLGRKDEGDCLHVVFGLQLSSTSRITAPHFTRGVLVYIMEIIPDFFVWFFCIASQ